MFLSKFKLAKLLSEKTILITGANTGIGFETALSLAKRKAKIILADNQDLSKSKEKIKKLSENQNICTRFVDFRSLCSVRNFAQKINEEQKILDVLINNVGVFCLGKKRTVDGLPGTMQVNHFGPFLLTCLLSSLLKKSAPSRVIFVSSIGAFFHRLSIDNINKTEIAPLDALTSLFIYYNSKLCNMITAKMFAKKLESFNVTSNCLHPGMTRTEFLIKNRSPLYPLLRPFTQDVETGAQNTVFLATSDKFKNISGKFFVNFQEHEQPRIVDDEDFCEALWTASEYFVNLSQEEKSNMIN